MALTGAMLATILGTAAAGAAGAGISAIGAKKQRNHDKDMATIHTIDSDGKNLDDDLVDDINTRFGLNNMGPGGYASKALGQFPKNKFSL